MNRLAQALITLTDPASKATYDSELGIAAVPQPLPTAIPKPDLKPEPRQESVIVAEPVLDDLDLPEAEPLPDPHPTEVTQEIALPEELKPRYEVVPAPRVGYVWAPGFWDWRHGRHIWVKGHYERERRGYHWNPTRWEQRPR